MSPFDPGERYLFSLFIGNQMWVVLVGWFILAIAAVACWLLVRSPWGRVVKAIREDEDAARSLGKNAYWYKMQALYIGGVFGALGGMLRAIGTQSAQPDNFITDVTFFVWVALILGGAVGNLVDRVLYGYVIDFIDVYYGSWHWPTFNVADSAISAGAFLLLLDAFRGHKDKPAAPR